MTTIRKIVLGTALAASAVTAAAPASAHDYHGNRGGDGTAVAIGAGIIGLAIGAAIASSDNHRGYDDYRYRHQRHYQGRTNSRGTYGQYDSRSYGSPYYGNQYYGNQYYGNGYNGGGYYNGYNGGYNYGY